VTRMERLPVDEARAAAEEESVVPGVADLSVFQVLLRHPPLARVLYDLLAQLLGRNVLDARLRELVIMRIAWTTASVYEWTQHWPIATGVGVAPDDVLGVRDWQAHAGFGPAEQAVLAATDETLATGRISDETWQRCAAHLGDERALLELVAAIGTWHMISTLLRSLDIPLEDGTAPWPPDGAQPL
jgi:alkylhydroperoxidase family enzyme